MKRKESLAHIQKLSPIDLRTEIDRLEKKLQQAKLSVTFGQSKAVRDIRQTRVALARVLTIGNQKIRQNQVNEEK